MGNFSFAPKAYASPNDIGRVSQSLVLFPACQLGRQEVCRNFVAALADVRRIKFVKTQCIAKGSPSRDYLTINIGTEICQLAILLEWMFALQ